MQELSYDEDIYCILYSKKTHEFNTAIANKWIYWFDFIYYDLTNTYENKCCAYDSKIEHLCILTSFCHFCIHCSVWICVYPVG